MKVVLTGADGFVGRAVARCLENQCDIVATDVHLGDMPGIEGDLCDPNLLSRLFEGGCDAVIHLATVPGGAAELEPEQAKRVNVDASMALVDAAARLGNRARFIFASSIAVFGSHLPPLVDDETPLAPTMIYGAHKAMIEQWIDAKTRRGTIAGLSLRLPGIVARPPGPSGMRSAFMSEVFHRLSAHQPVTLPVSPHATMWLMSVGRLAQNIAHALRLADGGSVNLPALRLSMADLVAAIADATGSPESLVKYRPDPDLEAGFGRLPLLSTPRATALGFTDDGEAKELVRSVLAKLS